MTYSAAIDTLDRITARHVQHDRLIGLDWASSTIGYWYLPGDNGRPDYLAVSIVGDMVRCTDFEDGARISSIDLTPDQWRNELAGMLMLGFERA